MNEFRCYERKVKSRQSPGVEPRTPLAWAANALPLSHNSRTTTSPHNSLCVLHRWYGMPQSHTWQPLSMCRQNSVRGQPENSLRQERTHAECFSTICAVHIEDCEGWWLFGCCGSVVEHWPLKPEMSWVRLPATASFFTFLYFAA